VTEKVLEAEIVGTWSLTDSLLQRPEIEANLAEKYPNADLLFRGWLTTDFLVRPCRATPSWRACAPPCSARCG